MVRSVDCRIAQLVHDGKLARPTDYQPPEGWTPFVDRRKQVREARMAARAAAAPQGRMSPEDRAILEAVHREMDEENRGNAPGHAHDVPGIWDDDNGDLAGKSCALCLTWAKFTRLIKESAQPG
jgi:hypothetical protein